MESSFTNEEDLKGTIAELSKVVNQLSAMMVQIEESLARMVTRLANLETNWHEDNHQDEG